MPKDRWPDWTLLRTQGRGRYVGAMLHVWNPHGAWWGEGDEKFFVDGEKFPSTFGTGTEDYFGYAWCHPGLFQRAFHCQTMTMKNRGHQSLLRWHIADNVPFQKSFEGTIEKYFRTKDRGTLYAATVCWYLSPDGVDPYGPVPVEHRKDYYATPPLMASGYRVIGTPPGHIYCQSTSLFPGVWQDDDHLLWANAKPGDKLEIALPVEKSGTYAVSAVLTKCSDYGIFQLTLDGKRTGEPIDLYDPRIHPTKPIPLGTHTLSAGEHTLGVEVVGTNPKARAHYIFGMDRVILATAPRAASVRVDSAAGAPRLLVNGQPVRARMFWGGPGGAPIPIGPKARLVSFEFKALEDEPARATMHLRFGKTHGEIVLDDITVTDLDTGRDVVPRCDFEGGPDAFARDWTFWPTGKQNTVGTTAVVPGIGRDGSAGLRVRLTAPKAGGWPDFHIYHHARLALVKGHRHRVTLWARADRERKMVCAFYRPGRVFTYLGGPPGRFESQIKLAANVEVNFVSFPCYMPWPRPGETADWRAADAACEQVLAANPKALLLPRIGMEPPWWWREKHSDDIMVWEDGPRARGVVVASPRYRQDAAERLTAIVAHLEERFGARMAGYHPCGQNTGEWFYQDTWKREFNGYSAGVRREWRRWLTRRYGNDTALREAWGDDAAALASAEVPTPTARRAAPAGIFRNPAAERSLIDFAEFQQEAMADCVCALARAVRQASKGRKLIVFFYGYVFEFTAVHNGAPTSGHYALRRVLDSPDIDVLCSPISYFDRGLGGSAPAMTAAESVALAGKMWLYEDDTSTYLSTGEPPGSRDRVKTLEDTNSQLVRNVAQCALRNFGTWWMDLTRTGWFNDPAMWAEMARLENLDEPLLRSPTPFRPEIAAVVDERSMLLAATGSSVVTRPGVYEARQSLARSGAPYGQYLLDDVLGSRVRAKLYVFLNAWQLSADQRKKLLAATRGSTRVWCYAPGYFDEYRPSLTAMRELTGFDLRPVSPDKAWAEPTAVGKGIGLAQAFGVQKAIKPLFAAHDVAGSETLATYPDGSVAVAMRQTDGGASVFVGAPGLTSELVRTVARKAGVHLFTQSDCNVYANGAFLALHACQDGPVKIDTGRPGPIRDVLIEQAIGRGPVVTLPLRRGQTRVLRY